MLQVRAHSNSSSRKQHGSSARTVPCSYSNENMPCWCTAPLMYCLKLQRCPAQQLHCTWLTRCGGDDKLGWDAVLPVHSPPACVLILHDGALGRGKLYAEGGCGEGAKDLKEGRGGGGGARQSRRRFMLGSEGKGAGALIPSHDVLLCDARIRPSLRSLIKHRMSALPGPCIACCLPKTPSPLTGGCSSHPGQTGVVQAPAGEQGSQHPMFVHVSNTCMGRCMQQLAKSVRCGRRGLPHRSIAVRDRDLGTAELQGRWAGRARSD